MEDPEDQFSDSRGQDELDSERDIVAAVKEEMFGVSDKDNKLSELQDRTMEILARACSSNNPKVKEMYHRWQNRWLAFMEKPQNPLMCFVT